MVIGKFQKGCPAFIELETLVCDWYTRMFGLPKFFLSSVSCPESQGQGIIQVSTLF